MIKKAVEWEKNNPERRKILKRNYDDKEESKKAKKLREQGYRDKGNYKNWQEKNRDRIKQYNENRRMHKKHKISEKEWEDCKRYFNNKCAYCGLPIDKHFNVFRGELRLTDFHKEHVDHDGSNDLSNCVPSCKKCNSSKRDSVFEIWYTPEKEFYREERLIKLHKWLDNDFLNYKE